MADIIERGDGRSLVAPVVSVEGVATVFWMSELYRFYEEQKSLGIAVRQASRAIRESLPHPAFWGAFVLVGDPLGGRFGPRDETDAAIGWSDLRAVPGEAPPWLDPYMAHYMGWTIVVVWDAVDKEWTAHARRGIFLSMVVFVRAGRSNCEEIQMEHSKLTKELAFQEIKDEIKRTVERGGSHSDKA
jgi:hypothetical protein